MKYERLTDKKWKEIEKHCYAKGLYFSNQFTEEETDEMIKRLAELEDKIESGKMIELPKIYQLSVGCKGTSLETYFIDEIAAKLTSINGMWSLEYKDRLCGNGGRKLIGYFTDKSQAEARLKELQGE